jgi:hypothetical protein
MLKICGQIFSRRLPFYKELLNESEYFYRMKAIRRLAAAATVAILAFRAVGSFLSWVEHQEDSVADTWVDEDEFEDA